MKALEKILDTIDIETFIQCSSLNEGKVLALELGKELGLGEVDIMFIEFDGYGVRVRLRKYIYKPGNQYGWLRTDER